MDPPADETAMTEVMRELREVRRQLEIERERSRRLLRAACVGEDEDRVRGRRVRPAEYDEDVESDEEDALPPASQPASSRLTERDDPVTRFVVDAVLGSPLGAKCRFDVADFVRRTVRIYRDESAARRRGAAWLSRLLMAGGVTQSRKTPFIVVHAVVAHMCHVPVVIVTQYVKGANDLVEKMGDLVRDVGSPVLDAVPFARSQGGKHGMKRMRDALRGGGIVVVNDTVGAVNAAIEALRSEGFLGGRTPGRHFSFIKDEADSLIRSCESDDGRFDTAVENALRVMDDGFPVVNMSVSATLMGLMCKVAAPEKFTARDVFVTSPDGDHVDVNFLRPLHVGGEPVFLRDRELNVANCFVSPSLRAMMEDFSARRASLHLIMTTVSTS